MPPIPPPATPVTPPTTPVAPAGGTVAPTTQPESADLPVTGPNALLVLGQAGVAAALLVIGTTLLRLGRRSGRVTG